MSTSKHDDDTKPAAWSVSTDGGRLDQDSCPSGHGSVHVDDPDGGYQLSVHGFDRDGYPITSRWYDDD